MKIENKKSLLMIGDRIIAMNDYKQTISSLPENNQMTQQIFTIEPKLKEN
jgi:hypothetical protein